MGRFLVEKSLPRSPGEVNPHLVISLLAVTFDSERTAFVCLDIGGGIKYFDDDFLIE